MTLIEERNLKGTIENCLKEHSVQLTTENKDATMYLIEVNSDLGKTQPKNAVFKDFKMTYPEADKFQTALAKKVFHSGRQRVYGVLVDKNLQFQFAFNRLFADMNHEKKIEFKELEELLLGLAQPGDIDLSINSPAINIDDFTGSDGGFGNGFGGGMDGIVLRYSLSGHKNGQKGAGVYQNINFERANLIERVKETYKDNLHTVTLGVKKKRDFFIIQTRYETSLLQDFLDTYDDVLTPFQKKIAPELIKEEKHKPIRGINPSVLDSFPKGNEYVLLLDESLQIQFAYNTKFAAYDAESQQILYANPEEILLGKSSSPFDALDEVAIKVFETAKKTFPKRSSMRRTGGGLSRGFGRGTAIKYSLTGPKE
jgi:hypothetical protein